MLNFKAHASKVLWYKALSLPNRVTSRSGLKNVKKMNLEIWPKTKVWLNFQHQFWYAKSCPWPNCAVLYVSVSCCFGWHAWEISLQELFCPRLDQWRAGKKGPGWNGELLPRGRTRSLELKFDARQRRSQTNRNSRLMILGLRIANGS
jgi:hypothetical protein